MKKYINFKNPFFLIVLIWSLTWKGIALWHAVKNKQFSWFASLLFANTAGILEMIYLAFFRKAQE